MHTLLHVFDLLIQEQPSNYLITETLKEIKRNWYLSSNSVYSIIWMAQMTAFSNTGLALDSVMYR